MDDLSVYLDGTSDDDDAVAMLVATNTLSPGISRKTRGGSRPGKAANMNRDFDEAFQRNERDYFGLASKYDERLFERRFRMPRSVFDRIRSTIEGKGMFVRRQDAVGRSGIHPLQRIVAAIRQLAYGIAADGVDEYTQLSETSATNSLKAFCREIVASFGTEYLRQPTEQDLRRILAINAARGFPGCVGSIDCQHWRWKNCPIAWAGQFTGKEKGSTIVLEAIADAELWIWHSFFGSPGSLNDINVLDRSPTIVAIMRGELPPDMPYTVHDTIRKLLYYLADGIYPDWALFQKTIREPTTRKQKTVSSAQEALRKDVERAFGVLVSRFHILERPARLWFRDDICAVMQACIIMHNMIVEARRDSYDSNLAGLASSQEGLNLLDGKTFVWHDKSLSNMTTENVPEGSRARWVAQRETQVTDRVEHFALKEDLINHIWERNGSQ